MKSKAFKLLRGRTILVDIPERKKSSIQLTAGAEAELQQEAIKSWNKLNVYAVGDKVEDVVVGDKVYIRATALMDFENVEKIEVEGVIRLVFNEGDIVIVW
jgi:hypothetical protein